MIFAAIFVVEIHQNCYDFIGFRHFSEALAWQKNVA